jgi:hypothetical protein
MNTEAPMAKLATHPLELELAQLLNRHSADNDAGTPDYILAQFLFTCLSAYKNVQRQRVEHETKKTNQSK